jgi:hypothetical protein
MWSYGPLFLFQSQSFVLKRILFIYFLIFFFFNFGRDGGVHDITCQDVEKAKSNPNPETFLIINTSKRYLFCILL